MARNDYKKLKLAHINLNHAKLACNQLAEDILNLELDIISINEPYTYSGKVVGIPNKYIVISDENALNAPRAAIILKDNLLISTKTKSRDIVTVQLEIEEEYLEVTSVYCPPSQDLSINLAELELDLQLAGSRKKIILGDFNAKSSTWGQRNLDVRGEELMEFCGVHDLLIINDPHSIPTYSSTIGESWIDLTLLKNIDQTFISNWDIIDAISGSDHNLMVFEYNFMNLDFPDTRRWKIGSLNRNKFREKIIKLILENSIDEVAIQDLEDCIEVIEKNILEICQESRKKPSIKLGKQHAIWWTQELTVLRKKVRARRRRFQAEYDIQLRLQRKMEYKRELAFYKRKINMTKKNQFRNYIESIVIKNSFGTFFKVAKGKMHRKEQLGPILLENGLYTNSQNEAEEKIFKYYFRTIDENIQLEDVESDEGEISPDISASEVGFILKEMKPTKAPGFNGLYLDIYKEIFTIDDKWFVQILNRCFQKGIFPKYWKVAKVLLFHKEGKKKEEYSSYRPICLLPIWGKILDRIITQRLVYFLESNEILHKEQYGFRKGIGTQDAIKNAISIIRKNREMGLLTCMITIDIKNAFGSIKSADILRILKDHNPPENLYKIIRSFLIDRSVLTMSDERLFYNLGVPQGSSLGPILWLLIANEALKINFGDRIHIQAFADDFLILIGARACYHFSADAEAPLQLFSNWANQYELKLSFEKCKYTIFPLGKQIGRRPAIKLSGNNLQYLPEIKYLGLLFDHKLSWLPHLNLVLDKIMKFENKLKTVARATWGLKPNILKNIYICATERLILFGVENWYSDTCRIQRKLWQIQRKSLLGLSKGYRTVSSEALQVLTGCLPLDMKAKIENIKFKVMNGSFTYQGNSLILESKNCQQRTRRFFPPWKKGSLQWDSNINEGNLNAYTDGSKMTDRAGGAFLIFREDIILAIEQFRTSDLASIFDAEALAILKVVKYCIYHSLLDMHIHSDSKAVLSAIANEKTDNSIIKDIYELIWSKDLKIYFHWVKAHTGNIKNELADSLAKNALQRETIDINTPLSKRQITSQLLTEILRDWQNQWDNTSVGRPVYRFFPTVSLKRLQGDFYLNQVYTGHGAFGPFQNKFFGRNPICFCALEDATIEHVLYRCSNYEKERNDFFPRNYPNWTLIDLMKDASTRKGIRLILMDMVQKWCDQ